MWYNPPYCSSVNINLGKEFLKLVDKKFPNSFFYNKTFNRKTVKIVYSCMSNVKTLIQSHNRTVISNFINRHIKANTNNNKDNNNVDIYNISNYTNILIITVVIKIIILIVAIITVVMMIILIVVILIMVTIMKNLLKL